MFKIILAWIRLSAGYLLIGLAVGIAGLFTQSVELGILFGAIALGGWVTMALIGLIYSRFYINANKLVARLHFWFYQLGFLTFLIGLILFFTIKVSIIWIVLYVIGGTFIVLSVILFLVYLFHIIRCKMPRRC